MRTLLSLFSQIRQLQQLFLQEEHEIQTVAAQKNAADLEARLGLRNAVCNELEVKLSALAALG